MASKAKYTVYGIPTCGTVKKARKWLDGKGIEYVWVDLREKPPTKARLTRWMKAFGPNPMRNTSGGAYRALPAFVADAMLLKRPVLEIDGKPAAVGFKQPDWEALF